MDDTSVGKVLERLGLTEYEAKTLSTLFKLKESEAPHVSRIAQVPKTRVYDVLDKLVQRGLVIEITGRPKRYRVIDSREAIDALVNNKKEETGKLESEAQKLKDFVFNWQAKTEPSSERVMKVKDKFDFEKILSQELEQAKNHLSGFSELRSEEQILNDAIAKAYNRNVTVRLVNSTSSEAAKRHAKKGVSFKHFNHGLNAYIIDNKKVIMALSDFKKEKSEYYFAIWNNNVPLANTLQHYFDNCWDKGKTL